MRLSETDSVNFIESLRLSPPVVPASESSESNVFQYPCRMEDGDVAEQELTGFLTNVIEISLFNLPVILGRKTNTY